MLHKNNLKKLLKILSINHYHLVLLFFLYTMTTLQNAINEAQKEFIENLSDYEMYWYESAEEFLFDEETTDWHDNALYYQWYLEGMKAMKLEAEKLLSLSK